MSESLKEKLDDLFRQMRYISKYQPMIPAKTIVQGDHYMLCPEKWPWQVDPEGWKAGKYDPTN